MRTLNLKTLPRVAAAIIALVSFNLRAATRYVALESPNPSPPYATWATAAHVIQDAVDAASPGDEVVVTNGVYRVGTVETNGLNRVALTKPVTLRSVNGPGVTVIEGATNGVRCAFVGDGSVLSGFTLTKGTAVGSWAAGHGGGVCSEDLGVVTNSIITGNSASDGGGGFGGTLYRCTVISNSAAWDGGGYHSPNSSQNGCALYNCTLIANSAYRGGGAHGGTLYNCTLTGKWAEAAGGGVISWRNGIATLSDCIVYFNLAPEGPNYADDGDAPGSFWHSCTSPLPTNGVGNIDADPRLMNAAVGDFRLRPDSPCIDAGTNLTESISTDLLGLPRPLDGNGDGIARFDMGAYEFNPYRFGPDLRVTPNGLEFSVQGEPGKTVLIERSRDLATWELVATVPMPAAGQTLIDPAAASEPFLFYRAAAGRSDQ